MFNLLTYGGGGGGYCFLKKECMWEEEEEFFKSYLPIQNTYSNYGFSLNN